MSLHLNAYQLDMLTAISDGTLPRALSVRAAAELQLLTGMHLVHKEMRDHQWWPALTDLGRDVLHGVIR